MSNKTPASIDAVKIEPIGGQVDAEVTLPGSKSYTNRVLPIAAMAQGTSTIREALFSDDTRYMADALRALGVSLEADEAARQFAVVGTGGHLPATSAELFVGNSGTSARFLTAFLSAARGEFVVDGVERMRLRPIEPLLNALRQLGVDATSIEATGCPPVRIRANGLGAGTATLDGSESSQYLSALLMAAPLASGDIDILIDGELVSKPYIDLTISTMSDFGASVDRDGYQHFRVLGGQGYRARDYAVEPDASAASYFFALAAATGGRVRVRHLGSGSIQGDIGFLDVLEQMGCAVERAEHFTEVRGPKWLRGADVDMNAISDTAQTLAAIAPLAEGPVRIRNIAHVRAKETDRITATVTELRRLGVQVEERDDGLTIVPGSVHGARIETYDDHRMAMSFAILGCVVPGISIADPACVAKTFPDFFDVLSKATRPGDR